MSDLFKHIVKIELLDHVLARCGGVPQKTGKTIRINPCPLCGHRDCFTVYEDSNSFKCFSCDKAGDIINFERRRLALDSNLAAAKDLARQYNINIDDPKPPAKQAAAAAKKTRPTKTLPEIDRERAQKLRAILADYFHKTLLNNPQAIQYQTDRRGHSLETLKTNKIGLSDGPAMGFIPLVEKSGFTTDDLLAVGIIKPKANKKGFWPGIGREMFVYPQFYQGRVLHFTIKDPNPNKKQRRKFQLVRDTADPDWLFYGQNAVESGIIWLVEGEDDRLSCLESGLKNTMAIIGNFNTPRILKWISENAKDKTFFLAFDPDDAGEKYYKKFGPAIAAAGGIAKSLEKPIRAHQRDIDDILKTSNNRAETIKKLIAGAETLAVPADPVPSYDFTFESFEVLGELENNDIAFWSSLNRRTYFVSIKDLSLDKLCQIGGKEVARRVSRTPTDGMITFKTLKKHLIIRAAETQLGTLHRLGQGIHLLKKDRLLIVNGAEAYIWDGIKFTRQTHPLIEYKLIHWQPAKAWVDFDELQKQIEKITPEYAYDLFTRFADLFGKWGFAGGLDVLLITGWVLAQIVQTAWRWRPHLWLTGAQGSGKTTFTLMIEEILGESLVLRREGSGLTEPGFRQALANDTLMPIIDEFEKSADRKKIIEILRSAGRGGTITKGTAGQTPISYYVRHMVMVCSIETGLIHAAEKHRYLVVSTKKEPDRSPEMPSLATCNQLKLEMIAYALWAVNRAKDLIRGLAPQPGFDSRFVESVAVPLSMVAVSTDTPAKSLQTNIEYYLGDWNERQAGTILEDEVALLQDILLAKIRVAVMQEDAMDAPRTINVERTVAQLLTEELISEDHNKALQANGVRRMEYGIFISPSTVSQQLLFRTRWKDMNIRDILLRLPGARSARVRLAGVLLRGITLPDTTWWPNDEEEGI